MSKSLQANEVITGKVRFSFCNLLRPRAMQPGQDEKYSTTILVPKSDVGTKMRIDAAIEAAKQIGKDKVFNGIIPPIVASVVYDGDGVRPSDGMTFGNECKGHWVFTATNKNAPVLIDLARNPILDGTQIYSGMFGRVGVRFFAYNNSGKKGVGCSLDTVQKLEDGEPLGGSRIGADAFDDDFMPAPVQQQYQAPAQQPQYQAPVQQPQYQPQAPQGGYQAPAQPGYTPQYPQQQQQQGYPQQQVQQSPPIDPITGQPIIYGI